ncbi:Non-specific serine/threonine protein kinase [Bertholletia excelsa]
MKISFQISILFLFFLCLQLPLYFLSASPTCPLDFDVLRRHLRRSSRPSLGACAKCHQVRQGLRLAESEYLRSTSNFLPPVSAADSCWASYQDLAGEFLGDFDIRKACGFETRWISEGCMNITNIHEFEGIVSKSALNDVVKACNQSLYNSATCAYCITSLSSLQAAYLNDGDAGNLSDCTAYPSIYAAAVNTQFGPTDEGTAGCLFGFDFSDSNNSRDKKKTIVICVVGIVSGLTMLMCFSGFCFFQRGRRRTGKKANIYEGETSMTLRMESIDKSTNFIRFELDEIKRATNNFSRNNMIGTGGYGNVYGGVLSDGSEVAVKRFKNCSVSGDESFAHEVGVIASVRHVNLVTLRGYCIATPPLDGHQRIIVCELMKNGSLHDNLFGSPDKKKKLSWPVRLKIALGTARGLAYLHYGAKPRIIHRDIKASNILLDDRFEPKVADFGLARFTPDGLTHLSTRVAGTMGYLAPEYALYGQLTERSDVYGFGVVLLELLSGKKAIMPAAREGQPWLLTEWAWSLAKDGRAMEVVEHGMTEMGSPEVMERHVVVAVLCSHPQLPARPTMDHVVKMLESESPTPAIPGWPVSIIASADDIERFNVRESVVEEGFG